MTQMHDKLSCATCSAKLDDDSKFCSACGANVPTALTKNVGQRGQRASCATCSAKLDDDSKFCSACGANVPTAPTDFEPPAQRSATSERVGAGFQFVASTQGALRALVLRHPVLSLGLALVLGLLLGYAAAEDSGDGDRSVSRLSWCVDTLEEAQRSCRELAEAAGSVTPTACK